MRIEIRTPQHDHRARREDVMVSDAPASKDAESKIGECVALVVQPEMHVAGDALELFGERNEDVE